MPQISIDSLMSLEAYARQRASFRARVLAHKKNRTVRLGDHITLVFEDELTVRYQIQEMLRIERTFEEQGIRDELNVYNPLVPDGGNLKATMMIEYPDVAERRVWLAKLIGAEDRIWVRVEGFSPVYAVADEDLERETDVKTSSVHFLRFELTAEMRQALKRGAGLGMGVDHPAYSVTIDAVSTPTRGALCQDLE